MLPDTLVGAVGVTPFLAALGLALAVFVLLVWLNNDGNPNFVLLSGQDEHAVISLGVFLVGLWHFNAVAIAGVDVRGWALGLGVALAAYGAVARWTDLTDISFLFN